MEKHKSLIYCYGVIAKENSLNLSQNKGFEDNKIYTISFEDIDAIVSDISEDNFSQDEIDKNIKDMSWLAKNAEIHESVIDTIMKETTIMPMKFCTIFKTKERVEEMLKDKYADLKFNLQNLQNKIEMGIKIYIKTDKLRSEIKSNDLEIKNIQ